MEDYKYFVSLTEEESKALADKAFNEIKDPDEFSDTLLNLALFTNGQCLINHYPRLIEKKIFYPCEIYMYADHVIAKRLIQLVESENSNVNINHLLICLAWIGSDNVLDFFLSTSANRPPWTKKLHVSPIAYSEHASWIVEKNNKKRSLINPRVTPLTKREDLFDKEKVINTFNEQKEECQFCKNKLVTVFEMQINSDSYKTKFTTCLLCSCYEPVFMSIDDKGESKWYSKNKKSKHSSKDVEMLPIEENILKISSEQRKPKYSINQFISINKSQIGGFPTWVQDSGHLDCPNCKQKMQYVGQVDMEDVEDYGEGIYYFHYCDTCKIVGTNYQQT